MPADGLLADLGRVGDAPRLPRDIAVGRRVIRAEIEGLEQLAQALNGSFSRALDICAAARGRIGVSGIGKSGHVARKIAATLASTGTPAFFVHPAEASHGDLGMITPQDIVLMLSNSGETDELVSLTPHLKRQGARIIALTGNE